MKEIYCGDCGSKLLREDKPCPKCGSKKKRLCVKIEDRIEAHDRIKGKVKKGNVKKPIREFKAGDDLCKKTGKWHHREMVIDREKDWYREVVKNKKTGRIIHQCEEPLSKHRGHGSLSIGKVKQTRASETPQGNFYLH